jgi:flavin reductase (DIM6/NTAB) family NADH-FMN oxidoreductase RutF
MVQCRRKERGGIALPSDPSDPPVGEYVTSAPELPFGRCREAVSGTRISVDCMAAPGGTGAVGPFPPGVDTDDAREEYDRLRRRVLWSLPSGLYVIGSRDGDRRNGMTMNWLTQVSFDPKLVAIAVEHAAFTHELVAASGVFVVNTIDREDRAIVRKFTKPVDVDASAHTLNGFSFHDGPVTGAPVLDQAAAFVECAVRERVETGDHTLFVGEVVDCGFQRPEDTPVLRMEDTRMNYGG